MTQLPDPVLEFAFEVRVHVDPPLRVGGTTPHEALHVVPITGRTVDRPRPLGPVLPVAPGVFRGGFVFPVFKAGTPRVLFKMLPAGARLVQRVLPTPHRGVAACSGNGMGWACSCSSARMCASA